PAPAMTSSGPPSWVTALRCASLRFASTSWVSVAPRDGLMLLAVGTGKDADIVVPSLGVVYDIDAATFWSRLIISHRRCRVRVYMRFFMLLAIVVILALMLIALTGFGAKDRSDDPR